LLLAQQGQKGRVITEIEGKSHLFGTLGGTEVKSIQRKIRPREWFLYHRKTKKRGNWPKRIWLRGDCVRKGTRKKIATLQSGQRRCARSKKKRKVWKGGSGRNKRREEEKKSPLPKKGKNHENERRKESGRRILQGPAFQKRGLKQGSRNLERGIWKGIIGEAGKGGEKGKSHGGQKRLTISAIVEKKHWWAPRWTTRSTSAKPKGR